MNDTTTATPVERPDPANLTAWLADRDTRARAEAPAEPPAPAAVTPPAAQPVNDWREAVIDGDDVEYGFFRGKKVPDVINSYRSLYGDYQTKSVRLAELERENAGLKHPPKPEAPSQPDHLAIITDKFYEDPAMVATQIEELATQKAREIYKQEREGERATQAAEQQWNSGVSAATTAAKTAAETYGWSEQDAQKRVVATFPYLKQLQDKGYADAFTNPTYYDHYVRELFGEPAPKADPVVPPPVPVLSDPPGVKRPAAVTTPVKAVSALDDETSRTYDAVAKLTGLDPAKLKKRREK